MGEGRVGGSENLIFCDLYFNGWDIEFVKKFRKIFGSLRIF